MHTLEVVDLFTGIVDDLPSQTATLDVPRDFETDGGRISLDPQGQAHYVASDGERRVYLAALVELSERKQGELYLVDDGADGAHVRTFRLAMLDPG